MRLLSVCSAALALVLFTPSAHAVTGSLLDDFQDGTLQGWGNGGAEVAPTNVSTGGPLGLGDKYMNVTSSNHLAVFNAGDWAGDYQSLNLFDVSVDFRNPNASILTMRAVLFGPSGSRWTSTTPASVPTDSAWHHYTFSLRQADLTNVVPGDTYAATISGVSRLMFRYETTPSSGGSPFVGSVGIDNVQAIVPEPASIGLLTMTGVAALIRRRPRAA
jgi:hypothetical protein